MKNDNIVILHVFQDGLIFKGVANAYDSMRGVVNLYYYYSPHKDFKLQNIQDERVKMVHDINEYTSYFSNPEIDVILFHALPDWIYYLFDYIDDKKFVVWWAWGYDIYYKQGNNPPLIPLNDILKPLTKDFVSRYVDMSKGGYKHKINNLFVKIKKTIVWSISSFYNCKCFLSPFPKEQKEILSRIDAFYSPLDIEYSYMKNLHPEFRAKKMPKPDVQHVYQYCYHDKLGNILVNHSLTYTDNHLDVFDYSVIMI